MAAGREDEPKGDWSFTGGWADWTLAEEHADFLRFVRQMIALRMRHPALRRRTFFRGGADHLPLDIVSHGVEPGRPDFSWDSHSLAFALDGRSIDRPSVIDRDLYSALNTWREPLAFEILAAPSGRRWRRPWTPPCPRPMTPAASTKGP